MGIANFDASDVLVGAGNLLYAPKGTALPDETSVAVNDFAAWPTGWVHLGYTADAPTFNYTYDTFSVEAEQALAPLKITKTNESMTLAASLMQFDGDHLALVTGGTNTNTAAGAGQKGYSKIVSGGSPVLPEYMFAVEGVREDANGTLQPVRLFVWRGTIRANGDIAFAKAAATAIPVQIVALTDSSKAIGSQLFEAHVVTSPAS